jgi:serine/threonine protein kinase
VPTLPSSDRAKKIEAIFLATLQLELGARAAFLDQSCGTDIELRKEIEALLNSANKSTKDFFEQPLAEAKRETVADPQASSGRRGLSPRNVMGLTVGDHVGDYEVIGALGAGGIGEVYKVRHNISHRIEALKVLRAGSPESTERFAREIRVLASLSHPNIAGLHTAFRQGEHLLMVMEFVEGETLDARLRRSGLNLSQSIDYISQVLSALMYAHAQGVIHRDIKPSNIMLTANNRVKLLDFGLALDSFQPGLTAAGWVMGSLHYMSPEQVMAKKVDARSDLYSLGATLYESLTGKVPIDGESQYTIMTGHLQQQPIAPSVVNTNIPGKLSDIVLKALAKNPDDRFQSAEDFLSALKNTGLNTTQLQQFVAVKGAHSSPAMPVVASGVAASGVATLPPSKQVAPAPPVSRATPTASAAYSPETLDRITRKLAAYIGPIAKIVVQRAASRNSNLQDLYKTLAEEIESAKDRKEFLASQHTRHD